MFLFILYRNKQQNNLQLINIKCDNENSSCPPPPPVTDRGGPQVVRR